VPPARVSMIVAKVNSSNDPLNAISDGEAAMKTLIDAAKTIGGEGTEIQSSFYTVTPSLAATGKVYQVANAFKVTISDPSKVSELIRTFYRQGASSVTNVSFAPLDQEKTGQQARVDGVKKAKEEALLLAKASGKRLGKLVTIMDDAGLAQSIVSTENGSQETTSGVPKTIDITKKVSVTYEIW